jgi:hypothetical protein
LTGDEQLANSKLAGGADHAFSLVDATHVLTPQKLRLACNRDHLYRRCETLPILYPWPPLTWLQKVLSLSHPLRSRLGLRLSPLLRGRISAR